MGRNHLRFLSLLFFSGWWFQTFFIFHNVWDNPSHWRTHLLYFSRWLKPPTSFFSGLWPNYSILPRLRGDSWFSLVDSPAALDPFQENYPMAYSSKRKGKTYFGALRLVQGRSGDGGSKNATEKTWGPCYGKCWGVILGCFIYIYIIICINIIDYITITDMVSSRLWIFDYRGTMALKRGSFTHFRSRAWAAGFSPYSHG